MKKSEPKMILNVAVDNSELDDKIKIAMNDYIEKITRKHLDDLIINTIDKRFEQLLHGHSWDNSSYINGSTLRGYIKSKIENVITKVIDEHINAILERKMISLIKRENK